MKYSVALTAETESLPAVDPGSRTRALLRAVRADLESAAGRKLSYLELGRFAGRSASTAFDLLQRTSHPPIESLLCWLERLPENVRSTLVNGVCRCNPRLDHPSLSHEPAQCARLRTLISRPAGLTLIAGDSDRARTFVLAALGHEAVLGRLCRRPLCGLDLHSPRWFMPIDGVLYLNAPPLAGIRESIPARWSALRKTKGGLVLLNNVLSAAPELYSQLQSLAEICHVIAADSHFPTFASLCPRSAPLCILRVWLEGNDRICVRMQGHGPTRRASWESGEAETCTQEKDSSTALIQPAAPPGIPRKTE